MDDDDDQSTCVEPIISYYSPLTNRGVKEISNTKFNNSYRSPNNEFSFKSTMGSSVYNTIMLPVISSDGSIRTDNSNKNMNNSMPISKENISNGNYIKFDNTKTISSKSDDEKKNNDNDSIISNTMNKNYDNYENYKNYNDPTRRIMKKRTTYLCRTTNMNLREKYTQDMINYKYNNTENNYDSDNIYNYNKKYTEEVKNSTRATKTRHTQINDEKIPSLFLKTEKKSSKNYFLFKSKKRRKTQKVSQKINHRILFKKSKDKSAAMFFVEKSKSYSNEPNKRNSQSSNKKDKLNENTQESRLTKMVSKSNKNIKNSNDESNNDDSIKKIWTNKFGNKLKSNIKKEKKKKKNNNNERKISFKENNLNNKLVKLMFSRNTEVKNNKYESSGLKMLRDHINNRNYKEKKEDEKYKKEKLKKSIKKSLIVKDKDKDKNKNDKVSENKLKLENRRSSGFLSKEEVIKKIFENKTIREKKTTKRDKNKNGENNNSKKDIDKLKIKENVNDSNNNIILTVSRRKRSISLHYKNNKMNEISEALRAKIPRKNLLNINASSSTMLLPKRKKKKKLSDVEVFLKKSLKDERYNLFSKYTNTVFTGPDFSKYIISCLELIMDMDIDTQTRLKTKINFNFPKTKKKAIKKRIALFDLDETLVHCTGDINSGKIPYQHTIDIRLPGKQEVKVGINLRPMWKETLDLVKKRYHIVVHTASHQAYADAVLDFMDPEKKYFKYRLYRNNCSLVDIDGVKFYVKDLDIFNEYYDLKDIVIIDNSVLSFAYHLYNGIPIVPYYEGDNDNFLYIVGLYLEHIYKAEDLREANRELINLDYFYDIAKAQVDNADNIIDEESNVIDEDEENEQNDVTEENINNNNNNISKKGEETHKSKKSRHKSGKSALSLGALNPKMGAYSPQSARRTVRDLSENKLMSNSNLFNAYLEMKESKNSFSNNKISLTSKETKGEKALTKINFSNYTKLVSGQITEINKEDEKKIECKSEPEFNHNSFFNNGGLSSDDEEVLYLKTTRIKRGTSLINEDFITKKIKDAIMGNLKNIKNNFSNKFKDLDNTGNKS